MKPLQLILLAFLAAILTSCFKDEAKNAECDIISATIPVDNPEEFFNPTLTVKDTLADGTVRYDSIYRNTTWECNGDRSDTAVTFTTKPHADRTAFSPVFQLTPGASLSPASGSTHDFSQGPVLYTVTSEDGQYSRLYPVYVNEEQEHEGDTLKYDFGNYALNGSKRWYDWFELFDDGKRDECWATGNPGYNMANGTARPMAYPTTPLADGYEGPAVQLTTRATGAIAVKRDMRIAAGNLFMGKFNALNALDDPLSATEFGVPFTKKPLKLTGYYKYTPGGTFQLKSGEVDANRTDRPTIYGILYRNTDERGSALVLHGNDVQSNPAVVGRGIVAELPATGEWTYFEAEFKYDTPIDSVLLAGKGYNLTVVFSSSIDGAYFQGAVGSTLCIDKVRLICEKKETEEQAEQQ